MTKCERRGENVTFQGGREHRRTEGGKGAHGKRRLHLARGRFRKPAKKNSSTGKGQAQDRGHTKKANNPKQTGIDERRSAMGTCKNREREERATWEYTTKPRIKNHLGR